MNMEEKLKIDIYKGLSMIMEKINTVALSAVMGKSDSWIYNKLYRRLIKGTVKEFISEDLPLINSGIDALGCEIASSLVVYSADREGVIEQIKELRKLVSMQYICVEILKESKRWMDNRMRSRSKEGKACSFKEDDILRINMAAMQIANELRSIELIL